MIEESIAQTIRGIVAEADVEAKLAAAAKLAASSELVHAGRDSGDGPVRDRPARPAEWTILPAMQVPERPDLRDPRGRRILVHAVAHIEISAIELALLSVADFPGQPREYYADMLRVAGEEVEHARMLIERLRALGGELGEEPVHLGLWETAQEYPGLVERLAVVPRILEAKGLDVSGKLRRKLRGAGDESSAVALDRVYFDEIGHVTLGTHWYREVCSRHGLDPEAHFVELAARFRSNRPIPFDREGRIQAGFTEREMEAIAGRLR